MFFGLASPKTKLSFIPCDPFFKPSSSASTDIHSSTDSAPFLPTSLSDPSSSDLDPSSCDETSSHAQLHLLVVVVFLHVSFLPINFAYAHVVEPPHTSFVGPVPSVITCQSVSTPSRIRL